MDLEIPINRVKVELEIFAHVNIASGNLLQTKKPVLMLAVILIIRLYFIIRHVFIIIY